jgi:hypothetical protein
MFKTFPEFSKLALEDRKQYSDLVRDYPPISDIAFHSLMIFWGNFDAIHVSLLNGNLVIPYRFLGYDKHAGLSLIGTNKVDESICAIFDYLRERGDPVRLVNVPDFVIGNIRYSELFKFTAERGYDEYILPVSRFYPLGSVNILIRPRIRKFIRKMEGRSVELRSLDLSKLSTKILLLQNIDKWRRQGTMSDLGTVEEELLRYSIDKGHQLGLENRCLFIDGELYGYCVYYCPPHDKKYINVCHFKFDAYMPYLFEFWAYAWAKEMAEQGIEYINVDADYGSPQVRAKKMVLGPSNYFRKYQIEPI